MTTDLSAAPCWYCGEADTPAHRHDCPKEGGPSAAWLRWAEEQVPGARLELAPCWRCGEENLPGHDPACEQANGAILAGTPFRAHHRWAKWVVARSGGAYRVMDRPDEAGMVAVLWTPDL
jgi:hypothetical protein